MSKTGGILEDPLTSLLNEIIEMISNILPNILLSITILIIGYIVGKLFGKAIMGAVKLAKIDESFGKSELGKRLTDAGYPISRILSLLTRGAIYIITITAAVSVLNIPSLQTISNMIIVYLPRFIGGVIIFLFGAILIEWLTGLAEGLLRGGPIPTRVINLFTTGLKYLFYIILAFMMFEIAEIAPKVISSVALSIFTMIGVGVGLGFALLIGLGLREDAVVLLFNEPKDIKPGMIIEVGNTKGKVTRISAFLVEIRTEDGVHVVPKRVLLKNGYKILKKSESPLASTETTKD